MEMLECAVRRRVKCAFDLNLIQRVVNAAVSHGVQFSPVRTRRLKLQLDIGSGTEGLPAV